MDPRLQSQIQEGDRFPPHFCNCAEDMLTLSWRVREYILVDIYLEDFFEKHPQHRTTSQGALVLLREQMREHLRTKGIL